MTGCSHANGCTRKVLPMDGTAGLEQATIRNRDLYVNATWSRSDPLKCHSV